MICKLCMRRKTKKQMSKGRGSCKKCIAKRNASYRATDPEKWKKTNREYARKRRLGPDGIKHFDEQVKQQDGKCAICQQLLTKVCSDHNHETGQHRGALCDCCNRALGLFKDSVNVLTSAVAYLKKWQS